MAEVLSDYIYLWPNLTPNNHIITSKDTDGYNCAAFAAYDEELLWWPADGYYWPHDKDDLPEIENFLRYFQSKGYAVCKKEAFEAGFEKVAIYVNPRDRVRHLARQDSHCKKPGWWSSKMGNLEDIAHERLSNLESEAYGKVRFIMKRKALR